MPSLCADAAAVEVTCNITVREQVLHWKKFVASIYYVM
jgi:hypothetical protein